MAARPDTWMPLYVGDYLADTQHLNAAQHGAYLLLLMFCWRHGNRLPLANAELCQIAHMANADWEINKTTVLPFFIKCNEYFMHKRVGEELAKAIDLIDKRSKAGKSGAAAKHGKRSDLPQANGKQTGGPSPSPSPSPSRVERATRLPPDWQVCEVGRNFAKNDCHLSDPQIEAQAARFRDYWIAQPGQRGVKLDWLATWRNWVRPKPEAKPADSAVPFNERGRNRMASPAGG